MHKSIKKNNSLIILFILVSLVIPNFLTSIQRDIGIRIDEKNPNEISNTQSPQISSSVSYVNTTGKAKGVYVSGNYTYVADEFSGLAVINISDPTNPGTPIYEDTNGFARDVYVSGDYAYIADDDFGLAVINIVREVTTVGNGGTISFGNYYLIFLVIGIMSLVIVQKRRKQSSSH